MTVRVLLADDHRLFCDGLRSLLEREPGIEVVGETRQGRAAVEMANRLKPDVIFMDITMPDLNGVDATRRITARLPKVKVIGLSMHLDRRFVGSMLKAGACPRPRRLLLLLLCEVPAPPKCLRLRRPEAIAT